MILRTFLLFESLDKSDGVSFRNPFSRLVSTDFPSREFEYYIALSFERYEANRIYAIEMELYDPSEELMGKFKPYEFTGPSDGSGEARGIFFRQKIRFPESGTYRYAIYIDDKRVGDFTLVVDQEG